jgi:hypothetical protein
MIVKTAISLQGAKLPPLRITLLGRELEHEIPLENAAFGGMQRLGAIGVRIFAL